MKLIERLQQHHRGALVAEAALLVAIIGYVDYKTGFEVSLYVLYSIPILFVVWFVGRNAGLWISIWSALVWSYADLVGRSFDINFERFWNMSVQLVFFIFIVIGGAALKGQRDASRARAELLERFHTLAQILPVGIFRTGRAGDVVYVNERWRNIAGLDSCATLPPQWMSAFHPDDRDRLGVEWETAKRARKPCGFEARFQHATGRTVWVLGQIAPETDGVGGVAAYVGAVTDMTELRRLEREVLEISEREQLRIGQDLHDDLCQQLVALQYAVSSTKRLALTGAPEADAGYDKLGELVKEVILNARHLARRIFPVQLEQSGLMSALGELAESSSRLFGIQCTLHCPEDVLIEDHAIRAHLFRIAQEALSNAIRHGRATSVRITLISVNHRLSITVEDDGLGITVSAGDSTGMGLHIMHYRARMIGATLEIQRLTQGGTLVRCTLPQRGQRLRELAESARAKI